MTTPAATALLTPGAPEALGFDAARLDRAAQLLDAMTARGAVAGAGLVVARQGQIALERYAGHARHETAIPASANTLWLQASITKPVAAAAIMLLVERGQLALDQTIAQHLPGFEVNGKQGVTIRHLLTHTSGIDERVIQQGGATTLDASLAAAYSAWLEWPAGTRAAYNNTGFHLLMPIIASIAGEPSHQFIQREIFGPLGLHDSHLAVDPAAFGDRLAAIDDVDPGLAARLMQTGSLAGGLVSTPRDIAAFGQLFLNAGRAGDRPLLAPTAVEAMLRDHVADLEERTAPDHWQPAAGRGLAWRLNLRPGPSSFCDLASSLTYGHGGATGTALLIDPRWQLVIAFATNRWGWPGQERRQLLNAVYGAIVT